MKYCWRCKCEKNVAEFGKSVGRYDGLNPCCKPCVRQASAESRARNAETRKATCANYRAKNLEKCRQAQSAWRGDKERAQRVKQAWVDKNKGVVATSKKKWQQKNPHAGAVRKKRVRAATPPWADLKAIAAVYAEARRLTVTTGVPHDVDHIVPLKGRGVCGLHVHWNLQPLPAAINKTKGNTLEPSSALVMRARRAEPVNPWAVDAEAVA